jgi:hypothetical protein
MVSLSELSRLGLSSVMKVLFELWTSLMKIYRNDQQMEWLKNLAPTCEFSSREENEARR